MFPEARFSSPTRLETLPQQAPQTLLSLCALAKFRAPGPPALSPMHHLLCASQPSTLLLQGFIPSPAGTADLWETISPVPSDLSSNIPHPEVSKIQ